MIARSYRKGAGDVSGFADDYAFLIQGLLDLYEASFDVSWLEWAVALQEKQDTLFLDRAAGGYFSVTDKDPSLLLRMKEDYDGAEPSPNSVSALNLLRLAEMNGRTKWREQAEKTIDAFSNQLTGVPIALPQMLVALDFELVEPRQIVIAGKPGADDTRALLREVHQHFIPRKILVLADGGEGQKFLAERMEFMKSIAMIDGKATAYVCENYVCRQPVSDPGTLAASLANDETASEKTRPPARWTP